MDKTLIEGETLKLVQAFKNRKNPDDTKTIRGIFPTEIECQQKGDMIFMKADKVRTALFDRKGERMDLMALPKVSNCKIVLAFIGVKVKDGELSIMVRLHQMRLSGGDGDGGNNDGGCDEHMECLLSSDDDDNDNDDDDDEEEEDEDMD